ncbi:unnamed protein product [Ilex paraguariensis]|uniref:peptidylprolyl isomerase n=1 Tax=Ilex paraguariensis TaxID=185542 RepID=A0ABC8V1E8_9AQUA
MLMPHFIVSPTSHCQVISGIEAAVKSMKVGGIRRVIIPPSQGYQNMSQEPIPPNTKQEVDIVTKTNSCIDEKGCWGLDEELRLQIRTLQHTIELKLTFHIKPNGNNRSHVARPNVGDGFADKAEMRFASSAPQCCLFVDGEDTIPLS